MSHWLHAMNSWKLPLMLACQMTAGLCTQEVLGLKLMLTPSASIWHFY